MKKRTILTSLSVVLIAVGAFLFSTNGFHLLTSYALYKQSKDSFHKQIEEKATKRVKNVLYPSRPKTGEEMGSLSIPRIKATLPIYEGTNEDELARGIGHYANSVLPGERDNSVLAGHRDTVFRELGAVKIGDPLIVKTSAGTFTYKVNKIRIVDKEDRTVIVPMIKPTLTVSTCYPFHYIGPAPKRYVLVAKLSSFQKATT
ncbi:class D sortase [Gottfriedia sp. NPDC057991]|uniref:class D sortase n=1 Tax=Gottfriedia sp. NPDC057991 TaxID=3346298 RepID=UPI0036DBD6A1